MAYTYDGGTNGIGHLTSLTDQAGSGSYSYDPLGRISSEQRTIAGISKNLAYTYNLDNSVAKLTYPSGAAVTYTPDSAGRILSAIDLGNNISYVTNASYQADGSLTGFVSGASSSSFAGITNQWQYNPRLQVCRITALTSGTLPSSCTDASHVGNILDLGYNLNLGAGDNGNVAGITNYRDTSRSQTFTYDPLNRLISAQNAGSDCSQTTVNGKTKFWGNTYGYDPWGNLLQKTATKCGAENLSVTALYTNQLSGYGYDSAGNMTHDATTGNNYIFDQENRITGAAGYTYTYDADGNRVEKSNGSTGTIYWYMSPGIVAESDLIGNLQSEYVFFDGERAARKDYPSGSVAYYFSDHLKTASVITDSAGNIKEDEDFYPWGGELQFVNSDSNHYKFGGHERDNETGLDYMLARYYSNPLARFLTPDWAGHPAEVPYANFGNPQSLNLYTYGKNNPTTFGDPDGHDAGVLTFVASVGEGFGEALWVVGSALLPAAVGGAAVTAEINYAAHTTQIRADALTMEVHATNQLHMAQNNAKKTPPPPPGTQANPKRPGTHGKPDHKQTVEEERARLSGKKEVPIKTPNGSKGSRRADAVGTNPETGATEIVQVYRPTPASNIPQRETDAANDIEAATGIKPTMVPVRPAKPDKTATD